jgi:transcriptional regulator with XRE-family HTH domain
MTALEFKTVRVTRKPKLSQKEFALKLNISERAVQYYESGDREIPIEVEQTIYEVFKIDPSANKSARKIRTNATPYSFTEHNIMEVPVVNQFAYAGYLGGFSDQEFIEQLPKMPWVIDRERKGNYMCFEMKGESMFDGSASSYIPGDILLAREVRREYWRSKLHINNWDFIIVSKSDGILFKRIIKHDVEHGVLTLHSLNEEFEDFDISLEDISQIFNVVDIKRTVRRR